MAAPLKLLCTSVLRQTVRPFSSTCAVHAGKKWRLENGLAWTGSEYGPLTDLPDWSYADGRPAPPLKGQIRRQKQREEFAQAAGDGGNGNLPEMTRGRNLERLKRKPGLIWVTQMRRAVNLNAEVDQGIRTWRAEKEKQEQAREQLKSSMLKPKGRMLLHSKNK